MTIIHWEVDKSHQKRDCVKDGGSLRLWGLLRSRVSANQDVPIGSSDSKYPDDFDLTASSVSVRCI